MTRRCPVAYGAAVAGILILQWSCALIFRSLRTSGQEQLKPVATATVEGGPRVIIFALDGAGPDQLMQAIHSGKAPHLAGLLGKEKGSGLFEHAYAAPHASSGSFATWVKMSIPGK